MKKILILSILIIGNCIMESCCSNDDECFELELSGIKNFNLNGNFELASPDTIDANNFAILIESETIDRTCLRNFNFGSNLYALKCDGPLYFLKDNAVNISIKSDSDLSINFVAGSELKELFIPIELNGECLGEFNSSYDCLRDYSKFERINSIEDAFNELMAINFYLSKKGGRSIELLNLFSLQTNELIIEGNHNIILNVEFESGKSIELTAKEIYLK